MCSLSMNFMIVGGYLCMLLIVFMRTLFDRLSCNPVSFHRYVYDTFLWEHCEDMGYPATLFDSDHGGPSDDEGFVEGVRSGSGAFTSQV